MKIISIEIIFVMSFLMLGCKDDPVTPNINHTDATIDTLMPLSIGNYWLYREYDLQADGTGSIPHLKQFGFVIDDTLTQIIKGGSILCYKLFNCGEELKPFYDKPGSFEGSKLIYNGKDGLHYAGVEKNDTLKMAFDDLIFSSKAKIGSSSINHVFFYTISGNLYNIPDDALTSYTCISTDSLITTPAGNFKCLVYKMVVMDSAPLFRDEVYFFIQPKLGIVGFFYMIYDYNLKKYRFFQKTLLTGYKIKKGVVK
ncbi:MAG: hypothetical protein ACM3Q2_13440 [Syntrophothermus sp.]